MVSRRDLAGATLAVVAASVLLGVIASRGDPIVGRVCDQVVPMHVRIINGQAVPTDYRCWDGGR